MFVNIKAYAGGSLIYEVNPYDAPAGTLKGLDYPYQPDPQNVLPLPLPLDPATEAYVDQLVYEMHPESALTGETESFHFALATGRHKDNRIPPQGFRIADADARLSVPVYYVNGVDIGAGYFTQAEYDGGYDEVSLNIPAGADYVEVNLYYQTTSREYIEFLRDEIEGTGNLTLSSPTPSGEPEAYVVQTDPFFSQLKAWGDAIWQLWTHNIDAAGAAPFLMTQAAFGTPPTACTAPTPTLFSAAPGNGDVTLTWSDEHTANPSVLGYRLYYDQAGKAQLIADIGLNTTFTDTGLTNGVEYCYKVTSYDVTCESGFSNVLCAIPTNPGQATDPAGVSAIETGIYVGKGKNQTFITQGSFKVGDAVVMRASVVDDVTGLPLAGATVDLLVTGPETLTLITGPSDGNGMAEAIWQTKAPGKKNPGTTPGEYAVQVKNVTAAGYRWDGVTTSTVFVIQ